MLRKKLWRDQVLAFSASCRAASSRWRPVAAPLFWSREIGEMGHGVRLIPAACGKAFVKSEETQGAAMVFRVR